MCKGAASSADYVAGDATQQAPRRAGCATTAGGRGTLGQLRTGSANAHALVQKQDGGGGGGHEPRLM